MITRTMLLGCAMALALGGAGFAQQASDKNTAGQTQTDQTTTKTTTKKVVHHYRHHVHHARVAAAHAASTPLERQATRDLNLQQARMERTENGTAYMGSGAMRYPAAYQSQPGRETGLTPASQIPNGNPYQTATPAGGRSDTMSQDQAHAR